MSSENESIQEILVLLREFVHDRQAYDKVHAEEHEYLRRLIEEHRAKRDFWLSAQKKIIGSALWTVFIVIVAACGKALKDWLTSPL